MRNFHSLTLMATVTILALGLTSCGAEKSSGKNILKDFHAEMSTWKMADNAKKAYPNLSEVEAKKSYARKMMFDYFRKTKDPEKRQMMAAMVYTGFSHMNTRARPAYCGRMNVDINGFAQKFAARHKSEEKAVNMILARHDLTQDDVWAHNERFSMAAVKSDLMRAGGLNGTRSLCSDIKKKPQKYAQQFNFSKTMPNVAAQLRQAMATPVKQAEATVPTLRR